MSRRRTSRTLTSWSVMTYSLILQAYPRSLRQEFGASMVQVFGDAARDAWTSAGAVGLMTLWMKTLRDVVVSLVRAYVAETRDPLFRRAAGSSVLYACVLAAVVIMGAVRFGEFYQPPGFSRFGAPEAGEDALIAAYEQALRGEFGSYRLYAGAAGALLAVWLGATAALVGLSQRSLLHGAAALAAGVAVTIAAFELMPTVWFPLDRYPVGALWVMGGGLPLAAAIWLLVSVIGRARG